MPGHRIDLPPALKGEVFTRAQAVAAGVTEDMLRGPSAQSLDHGIYLGSDRDPTFADRVIGYLKVLPHGRTAVDGVTALQLWGINVGTTTPYRFVTTLGHRSRREGIRVRRTASLPACRGPVLMPLPALAASRVELGLLDLVIAGDWLIRAELATLPQVRRALTEAGGRGGRTARRAAELVRARVESPRETRLRLLIVLAGLPDPECNVELGDEWFFLGRVDLYLREWNLALEYEGDQHRADPDTYANDLTRSENLTASGVGMIRVAKQHVRHPCEVVWRVYRALVARGYDGPPPAFGTEWVAAFGRPCRIHAPKGTNSGFRGG